MEEECRQEGATVAEKDKKLRKVAEALKERDDALRETAEACIKRDATIQTVQAENQQLRSQLAQATAGVVSKDTIPVSLCNC